VPPLSEGEDEGDLSHQTIREVSPPTESERTALAATTKPIEPPRPYAIHIRSGLGDRATHQYTDLSIVVAGGRENRGQHVAETDDTPLANLWLGQVWQFAIERDRSPTLRAP